MRTVFGANWESFNPLPAALAQSWAKLGLRTLRLFAFWPELNPEPGVFKWDRLDSDISIAKAAGLSVYVDPLWAPAHAAGGARTYLPYTAGCAAWNDPKDGSKGIRFASELPECAVPPHIDAAATERFGFELAQRYGRQIDFYGVWNEPGIDLYWPPRRKSDGWADAERLVDEIIAPFFRGVRRVHPAAVTVGPEADSAGTMDDILRLEQDRGERWFDVVSFHPYAWDETLGFPADSIRRAQEFVDVAQRYGDGRPLWVSEISGPEERILEFVVQVMQEPIDTVLFHSVPFAADDGTPGKLYSRMRQIISGTAHGRPHIVRVD